MVENITLKDLDNAPAGLAPASSSIDADSFEKMRLAFIAITEEKTTLEISFNNLKSAAKTNEILDGLIEPFAKKTYVFMCVYCAFVGGIIMLNSFRLFPRPLSDSVAQILVGSTAATVIGLVGMVLTGVFVGARRKSETR